MSLISFFKYIFPFSSTLITLYLLTVTIQNLYPSDTKSQAAGWLDRISVTLGVQERVYSVVIDAGSTGSRVMAFTFFRSLTGTLDFHNLLWISILIILLKYIDLYFILLELQFQIIT